MIGLLGFAALVGGGLWLGLARRWIWLAAVLWWALLVLAHAPDLPLGGAPARLTGGDFFGWLALGMIAAPVLAYREGLRRLQSRARPVATPAPAATGGVFRPAELDRYARHIIMREIGGPGQRRLKDAKVLVVGAGGLGSPVLLYLAASGVGTIGVIDDDVVEASNLQRQIVHTDQRIGQPKVQSAEIAVRALNPFVEVRPYQRRLTDEIAPDLIDDYDLVLDGSDNFDTRYLVNRVCVQTKTPLIAAAITQWEGQLSLYDPARGGPCYECVFPVRPAAGTVPTCAEAGVAAPLPGVLGAMMAMEAVKHLTGAGEGLSGRLMIYDGLFAEVRIIRVDRRPDCPVCGGVH